MDFISDNGFLLLFGSYVLYSIISEVITTNKYKEYKRLIDEQKQKIDKIASEKRESYNLIKEFFYYESYLEDANEKYFSYKRLKPKKKEQNETVKLFINDYMLEIKKACDKFEESSKKRKLKEQNELLRQKENERKRHIEESIRKKEQEVKNSLINKFGYDVYKYKFKSNLSKEELGKRYERYIGYLYENDGYRVDYHGIVKGKKDGGIDIIAIKKKEVLIIQCKRYGKNTFVHENTINQLYGALTYQKEKYPNKNVRGILYTANNNIDDEALEKLRHFNIEHIVKEHPKDENYPLIKCNVGKDNSLIYHVPDYGMYDRIKIELTKGEFYCETPDEAEAEGFRKTK